MLVRGTHDETDSTRCPPLGARDLERAIQEFLDGPERAADAQATQPIARTTVTGLAVGEYELFPWESKSRQPRLT